MGNGWMSVALQLWQEDIFGGNNASGHGISILLRGEAPPTHEKSARQMHISVIRTESLFDHVPDTSLQLGAILPCGVVRQARTSYLTSSMLSFS